jgi:hypothetical protein
MKAPVRLASSLLLPFLLTASGLAAGWTVTEGNNPLGPGKVVDVKLDGKPVARLVHGEGQFKPYLHVFGDDGALVTNGGLDAEGKATGKFPHHRGIFIGWNQIASDLPGPNEKTKTYDLWHFNNGGKMEVVKFTKLEGGTDAATIVAEIMWRGGKKDTDGSDLLLTETRTLRISRPAEGRTQVDAHFTLRPARTLTLGGDLQHAGVHFRASDEVSGRNTETAYVWEPDLPGPGGKAVSKDFKWCRLVFPIKDHWYSAMELNSPTNPVEELSWRDYGRFGFFFKKTLKKDEVQELDYRFVVQRVSAPAKPGQLSETEKSHGRAEGDAAYRAYAAKFKK